MSTDEWLSSSIEARNRREKRDKLFFITAIFLLSSIGITAFILGFLLASRKLANQDRDDQALMARCTGAGFNHQQCGFLADLRQDGRRDADNSAALGSAAIGVAAASLAVSAGARAGR